MFFERSNIMFNVFPSIFIVGFVYNHYQLAICELPYYVNILG